MKIVDKIHACHRKLPDNSQIDSAALARYQRFANLFGNDHPIGISIPSFQSVVIYVVACLQEAPVRFSMIEDQGPTPLQRVRFQSGSSVLLALIGSSMCSPQCSLWRAMAQEK